MRTVVGTFICLTALASPAFAGSESTAPLPSYHLRGYYKLRDQAAIWQLSDNSPWQVVKDEPWIDARVVKWGYVPITHDSKHYYCLIDDKPRTGSNIARETLICGDASGVSYDYFNNVRPILRLYGGGP
jgi:hypothetical protein